MTVRAIHFQVPDLKAAAAFYGGVLGLDANHEAGALIAAPRWGARLIFDKAAVADHVAARDSRYWKIGLTLPDLDRAVAHLDRVGWPVSRPRQFLDIGYMCHLKDPAGLSIELLQQGFEGRGAAGPEGHDIGAQATLAHLTLRAASRDDADREWIEGAGMTLMSVQPAPSHGFTLYFYAATDERPPHQDLGAVENREWLWRRPYTLVEVQVFDDGRAISPVPSGAAGFVRAEV